MRFLLYASNGHGLGHLMRALAVARAVRSRAPSAAIMLVTNSEACYLAWREGFPVVKLLSPPANFVDLDPAAKEKIRQMNRGIVQSVLTGFAPDVVAVDFFPQGQLGDLFPMRASAARKVFIACERNPAHEKPGTAQVVDSIYDLVLIPHYEDESAARVNFRIPSRYTGPILIRSRDEALPRSEARRRLGLADDEFVIFVGFGGGGRSEYAGVRDWVLAQAPRTRRWTFAVARPPLFRGDRLEIEQQNVKEISYAPLAECWPAFDAAISTLGYNSAMELLHHGVPTIFVELDGGLDNWSERARRIENAGAGLPLRTFDTETLRRHLDVLTDPGRRESIAACARALVPENGAGTAAQAILDLA